MTTKVSLQTLNKLIDLIMTTPYRTASEIISFFRYFDTDFEWDGSRRDNTENIIFQLHKKGLIVEVIEQVVDPRNFIDHDILVEDIVDDLNQFLKLDLLWLQRIGDAYKVKFYSNLQHGDDIKNIIFASTGAKPDIVLVDALTNKIEIIKNAEYCLIYDRDISTDGLLWSELVDWWAERKNQRVNLDLERDIYSRLMEAIPKSSPPAQTLFNYYFQLKNHKCFPALLPEVYLHFDPKTLKERNGKKILPRQRMDFLLLLPNDVRIVIEVDGKQHYAEDDKASPQLYSDLVASDRDLKLMGYDVYHFGGYELQQSNSKQLIYDFFTAIFNRYL